MSHKSYHRNRGEEPCGKAMAEAAHYQALWWAASKGTTLPEDWEPKEPVAYVCSDNPDDREEPTVYHYQYHRYRQEEPCSKSYVERAWARAQIKAQKPLPDWEPVEYVTEYECGDFADATEPGGGHASRHEYYNEELCGKSRAERAWAKEEWKQGRPIDNYEFKPREPHICGGAADYQEPTARGYQHHRQADEEPCPKAVIEARWAAAQRREGRPLPDWIPPEPVSYACGEAHEAEEAGWGHSGWHRARNEPVCPKGRREAAWAQYQNDTGRVVDHYEPGQPLDYDIATYLYVRRFVDADYYWGMTSNNPTDRWDDQNRETADLSRKLRTGIRCLSAVVAVCPDRYQTADLERIAIQTGAPDLLLNIQHTASQTPLTRNDRRTGHWLNTLPPDPDRHYVITNQAGRWQLAETLNGTRQFPPAEALRIADHLREHNQPPTGLTLVEIPNE